MKCDQMQRNEAAAEGTLLVLGGPIHQEILGMKPKTWPPTKTRAA